MSSNYKNYVLNKFSGKVKVTFQDGINYPAPVELIFNLIGLFIAGLVYLSYKGWIDVKWMEMENATRS
jgi:uncharacterized membrane protein (Fun14 family)